MVIENITRLIAVFTLVPAALVYILAMQTDDNIISLYQCCNLIKGSHDRSRCSLFYKIISQVHYIFFTLCDLSMKAKMVAWSQSVLHLEIPLHDYTMRK